MNADTSKIKTLGNKRISNETVVLISGLGGYSEISDQLISDALRKLTKSGLFSNVRIKRENDVILVEVKENPLVNEILFEGNKVASDDELLGLISSKVSNAYSKETVLQDVKRLTQFYKSRGRYNAVIKPQFVNTSGNLINLIFEIIEGDLLEVKEVVFVGNKEFSDGRLREVVSTKETSIWKIFSSDDVYDPDRLNYDRELLRRFYLTNGYADFRIESAIAELSSDRSEFFITFTVNEGIRYKFGKIDINARLSNLKKEDLRGIEKYEQGDWYDAQAVEKSIGGLTEQVGELGYAFVDIQPRVNRDREKKVINITFEILEGPRVFVERIDIEGNVRTLDKVIRREFRLVEGDAFNSSNIRRSRKRIQNLGFFEDVKLEQVPGSAPDKAVVKLEVEEKSTGEISFGAGFSSVAGPLGEFNITETNFLGRGQYVKVGLTIAAKKSEIDFSFTEPFFLDREIRAGFDLFHTREDHQTSSSFDSKKTGGRLRSSYLLTEDLTQGWVYTLKSEKVEDVSSTASQLIRDQSGKKTLSQIKTAW